MYSIGEFSKMTGLTVKTLRFYHEKGLLVPCSVDVENRYRYYADAQLEPARIISRLRGMEFSLEQIAQMLESQKAGDDILDHLEKQKALIVQKQKQYRHIARSLDSLLQHERKLRMALQHATYQPEVKTLQPLQIAGVRMKGKYSDCSKGFSKIGKSLGRYLSGPALLLHYDSEYKEEDADFEACFPVWQGKPSGDITVRELPGGEFLCLLHRGPYTDLSRSYAIILAHLKKQGMKPALPSREVYLKGPGMIFKGNPKKYLTEIQIPVERAG